MSNVDEIDVLDPNAPKPVERVSPFQRILSWVAVLSMPFLVIMAVKSIGVLQDKMTLTMAYLNDSQMEENLHFRQGGGLPGYYPGATEAHFILSSSRGASTRGFLCLNGDQGVKGYWAIYPYSTPDKIQVRKEAREDSGLDLCEKIYQ